MGVETSRQETSGSVGLDLLPSRPHTFQNFALTPSPASSAPVPSSVGSVSAKSPTAILTQFKPSVASYLDYFNRLLPNKSPAADCGKM